MATVIGLRDQVHRAYHPAVATTPRPDQKHDQGFAKRKLIGTLYAGGVEKVGLDRYLAKACTLGQKRVR